MFMDKTMSTHNMKILQHQQKENRRSKEPGFGPSCITKKIPFYYFLNGQVLYITSVSRPHNSVNKKRIMYQHQLFRFLNRVIHLTIKSYYLDV